MATRTRAWKLANLGRRQAVPALGVACGSRDLPFRSADLRPSPVLPFQVTRSASPMTATKFALPYWLSSLARYTHKHQRKVVFKPIYLVPGQRFWSGARQLRRGHLDTFS